MLIKVIRQSEGYSKIWGFITSNDVNKVSYHLISYYENGVCIFDSEHNKTNLPVITEDVWNEVQERYIKSLEHNPTFEVKGKF